MNVECENFRHRNHSAVFFKRCLNRFRLNWNSSRSFASRVLCQSCFVYVNNSINEKTELTEDLKFRMWRQRLIKTLCSIRMYTDDKYLWSRKHLRRITIRDVERFDLIRHRKTYLLCVIFKLFLDRFSFSKILQANHS